MNNKNQNDAGKGDAYRRVNKKLYDENYDRIFADYVVVDNYYSDGMLKEDQEIVFSGSESACKKWLQKNQVLIGTMCGQYVLRTKSTHERLTKNIDSHTNTDR